MQEIVQQIGSSVQLITEHHEFKAFLQDTSLERDDAVLLNNSFIFRQGVKTTKSNHYLALLVDEEYQLSALPQVVKVSNFNKDFKLLSHHSEVLERQRLPDAVDAEWSGLGTLVFILVGRIEDTVTVSQPLNHASFEAVELDPTLDSLVGIKTDRIVVRETIDEERVWEALLSELDQDYSEDEKENLRRALGVALDTLQSEGYARLVLPGLDEEEGRPVIREITEVLERQRDQYRNALVRCDGSPEKDSHAFNEVLRIAYNFSSDALTFIRLLVSICDLKPLILWSTVGEHFALAEAFRQLPWVRSHQKASLRGYSNTIGDARNSTFHDLFPFRKSLEVELPDASLEQVSLRLFSEHSKKRDNELKYQDKELVEVLTEFTRARRRSVPPRFWRQNLDVMDSTIDLFQATGGALNRLAR